MTLLEKIGPKREATMKRPELLAPAGNLEKLKIAVHYGADAVYIGGQRYGLRSNADNFTIEEMREAVRFANAHGAKVFVAANIYAHNEDLADIADYLRDLQDAGISAIIAADPVVIDTALKVAPRMEVHLSTQQSTLNKEAVKYWKEEGLPRVVLAREASLAEIIEIKKHVDVEIEAFVHGAMCSSISGRCVLSNHFTDRDSNRGGCSQSCRWKYALFQKRDGADDLHLGSGIPVFGLEEASPLFTMGSKDMCMIESVPALIEAGIDSFKIEGRMKSMHYVASVVYAYRQAIDAYLDNPECYQFRNGWLDEIGKAANRPLNEGFYYRTPAANEHIYEAEDKQAAYDFAGIILSYDPTTKMAWVEQRNYFKPGYEIEVFSPQGVRFKQTITAIYDESGALLDAARHPLQKLRIPMDGEVKPMDLLRKKIQQ